MNEEFYHESEERRPIDRLALLGEYVRGTALQARISLSAGQVQSTHDRILALAELGHRITSCAVSAGGLVPESLDAAYQKSGPRLDQLDTPAARRYLEAIEAAVEAAAALDRERGHDLEDGIYGVLEPFLFVAREEVLGSPGKGLE